jgi:RimJ/RimL family protein N-acetyltransferase
VKIDTSNSIWQGKLIRLRALEPADWEAYVAWNQDDEQARSLYSIPLPQSEEAVRRWAEKEATKEATGDNFRFVIENVEGEVVGDLTTHHCDSRAGTFSYGVSIARERRRKGYAKEAILLALRYYFQELRYHKVTASVYSFNEASIRLHESLGFQKEGQIREVVYTRGRYFDEILYGMTADEFREKPGKSLGQRSS